MNCPVCNASLLEKPNDLILMQCTNDKYHFEILRDEKGYLCIKKYKHLLRYHRNSGKLEIWQSPKSDRQTKLLITFLCDLSQIAKFGKMSHEEFVDRLKLLMTFS